MLIRKKAALLISLFLANNVFGQIGSKTPTAHDKCRTGHEEDSSGPTILVRRRNGSVIRKMGTVQGRLHIEVSGAHGISSLEVTKGSPLIDSERNLATGCGSYILSDPTHFASSNTYTVDISSLPPGTTIYIQAFDDAGGVTVRGFTTHSSAR